MKVNRIRQNVFPVLAALIWGINGEGSKERLIFCVYFSVIDPVI